MAERKDRTGGTTGGKTLVWDLPLRLFHWALVGLIAFSYATAELDVGSMQLHIYSGYAILTLLIFRILWGFLGSPPARFRNFLRTPARTLAYARDLLTGREARYLGHNPLGALSVLAFILLIGLQVGTGLFADDEILTQGPLAPLVSSDLRDSLTGLHHSNFNYIVALIAIHLLAVAFHSIVKREGLIRAMITGRKRTGETPDAAGPAPSALTSLRGLAVLGVAAAAVYGIVVLLPAAAG